MRQHTHFNQTPHLTRIYHFYLSKSNPCHLLQNHQVVKPSTPSCKVHVHHMEPTTCNPFYTANKTNGSHKLNNSENTETPPPPRVQRNIAHRSSTLKCLNLPCTWLHQSQLPQPSQRAKGSAHHITPQT